MKSPTRVFVVLIIVSFVTADFIKKKGEFIIASKTLLADQKKIFDLLNHVIQQDPINEQVQIGLEFSPQNNTDKYTKPYMVADYFNLKAVPKYKILSLSLPNHAKQVEALFRLFYYAEDFETFYKTACWARENVNEGIFVYAFTTAFFHRKDCRYLLLPPLYEIYPFAYVKSDVIMKVSRIKEQGFVSDNKLAALYGVFVGDSDDYNITNSFVGVFGRNSEEDILSYFTQDVNLNLYYYHYNVEFPSYLVHEDYGINDAARGELFYYVHQQLLARYNLERFSNDYKNHAELDLIDLLRMPYNPTMRYHNGYILPMRPDNYDYHTYENVKFLSKFEQFEKAQCGMQNLSLNALGNSYIYEDGPIMLKKSLGGSFYKSDTFNYLPSVLERPETSVRDPIFFPICERYLKCFKKMKMLLPPYNNELSFHGVKVNKIEFTRLSTFMEPFDYDITNGVFMSKDEIDKGKERFIFRARQERLNHNSFSSILEISSEIETNAAVRIFLGPKNTDQHLNLNDRKNDFVEFDNFLYKLKVGKNFVVRNDPEFARIAQKDTSTREVKKMLAEAMNGNEEFLVNESKAKNGWPYNLLLPKGKKEGLGFEVYVIVTEFKSNVKSLPDNFNFQNSVGITNSILLWDDKPFGFPFDREINETAFLRPNIMPCDIKIYHN
ncbi:basic juvenile hormone-suppressible protein 2-like [Arctopsyche grandis]|uniref:basic juvenile hormone-suppressible protein 2-like n=1 Tax=Arctopsyche grandis TaxID=121162 RepID=UPI00406D6D8B